MGGRVKVTQGQIASEKSWNRRERHQLQGKRRVNVLRQRKTKSQKGRAENCGGEEEKKERILLHL